MMNHKDVKIGQTVHLDPNEPRVTRFVGTDWTVVKVNPSSVRLAEVGTRRTLLTDPEALVPGSVKDDPLVEFVPYEPPLDPGTVVEFTNRGVTALYVVTAETSKGYRIFPLGGSTRYYTGIPARKLKVIPLSELGERLREKRAS